MKSIIALFFCMALFSVKQADAQYFIPNQAWGGSFNNGYGGQWNNNYGNYNQNYNRNYNQGYNNDYHARGAHNLPAPATLPLNSGFNKRPEVTEANRNYYPQISKSPYPAVEYKWPSPGENRSFRYPTVRGVIVPELPTYSPSAGKRK